MRNSILIIEDDQPLQSLFRHTLRHISTPIDIVGDGQKAIRYLEENTPFLIFMDMRLPFLNGEHLLEYIHNNPRFTQTRIIVISATQSYGTLPAVKEFILKPIMPKHIIEIVEESLQVRH